MIVIRVRPGMYRLTDITTADGTPVIVTVDQLTAEFIGNAGRWRWEAETEAGETVVGPGDADLEDTLRSVKSVVAEDVVRMVRDRQWGWVLPA